MNSKISDRLGMILKTLEEAAAGESGAINDPTPSDGDVDAYIATMVDDLLANYEVDDDDAIDFVFSVIDDMVESGELPDLPEDTATAEETAVWLGKAKTAGLHLRVGAEAEKSAE